MPTTIGTDTTDSIVATSPVLPSICGIEFDDSVTPWRWGGCDDMGDGSLSRELGCVSLDILNLQSRNYASLDASSVENSSVGIAGQRVSKNESIQELSANFSDTRLQIILDQVSPNWR